MSNNKSEDTVKICSNPMSRRWCFTKYPEFIHCEITHEGKTKKERYTEILTLADICKMEFNSPYREAFDDYAEILTNTLPHFRLLYASLEEGDSKEHLHVQGYIEFSAPIRFKRLKEYLGDDAHIEPAKGDREHNREYIYHEGKHKDKGKLLFPIQKGIALPTQEQEQNMYDTAVNMILEGYSIVEVAGYYRGAILRFISALKALQDEVEKRVFLNYEISKTRETDREWWLRTQAKMDEMEY